MTKLFFSSCPHQLQPQHQHAARRWSTTALGNSRPSGERPPKYADVHMKPQHGGEHLCLEHPPGNCFYSLKDAYSAAFAEDWRKREGERGWGGCQEEKGGNRGHTEKERDVRKETMIKRGIKL